jgi:hypothetical protein
LQASGSRDKRVGAANVVHIDGARRHAQHHALELLHVQRRSQKRVVERRAKLSLQKECSPWVCSGMRTDIDAGPTNGREATRASDAGARVEHARHPLGSRVRVLSPLLITPTRPLAGSAPFPHQTWPLGLDSMPGRQRGASAAHAGGRTHSALAAADDDSGAQHARRVDHRVQCAPNPCRGSLPALWSTQGR